jgi:hypothetical protein
MMLSDQQCMYSSFCGCSVPPRRPAGQPQLSRRPKGAPPSPVKKDARRGSVQKGTGTGGGGGSSVSVPKTTAATAKNADPSTGIKIEIMIKRRRKKKKSEFVVLLLHATVQTSIKLIFLLLFINSALYIVL